LTIQSLLGPTSVTGKEQMWQCGKNPAPYDDLVPGSFIKIVSNAKPLSEGRKRRQFV